MTQNALLATNILYKNNSYKHSTDIINLNKTNAISFGGIDEWKKWKDKNPLYASLLDLQGYTATNGLLATIQPSVSLLANNIMLFCGYMKDKFCKNYKNQKAKEKLEIPPTVPVTITTILSAAERASTKDAIKTAVTTSSASGFNLAIGAVSGIITKLSEDAATRSALTVFIMEAYGGAVIYYLEKRRHNNDDGSSGNGSSCGNNISNKSQENSPDYYNNPIKDLAKSIEKQGRLTQKVNDIVFQLCTMIDSATASMLVLDLDIYKPETAENFFKDLDMEKLKQFHRLYENYIRFYFPKEMDIKETYSIELDKKTNKIYLYNKIENEIILSMDNNQFEMENSLEEEKIEEEKKLEVNNTTYEYVSEPLKKSYSYTPSYTYIKKHKNDVGGMLCI